MLPTELELVPGFIATLKQYNWRYIAIINQEENVFINVSYQGLFTIRRTCHLYSESQCKLN